MAPPEVRNEEDEVKRKSVVEQRQFNLKLLLMEDQIDWDQLREYCFMEGLDPNYKHYSSWLSTAHQAAYAGEQQVLRWCLKTKADPDARNRIGRSAMHYACEGNKPNCIRVLLDARADPNIRNLTGSTPLHSAARMGAFDSVLTLIAESKSVLDIDAEDQNRRTPESLCMERSRIRKSLRTYRESLDDKRKAELVEFAVWRLFKLFDTSGDGLILAEEWADSQALLAQHFEEYNGEGVEMAFELADANSDGKVDWPEFLASHVEMLEVIHLPFNEVMFALADLECHIFRQQMERPDEKATENKVVEPEKESSKKAIAFRRQQTKKIEASFNAMKLSEEESAAK